ncbi:hypothetical protein SH668x_001707 [Planctomicrobium sp. SH668]|uniref:hypothetical protein n=1 Tax=Planctomicrobium sp. SH668 TaxID=3448126 RepID=UPI003F5C4E01
MLRREFLESTLAVGIACLLEPKWSHAAQAENLQLATFRFDATPPIGHPLCGGWIASASAIDDQLEGIGFVLTGTGQPVVICALDWTGLLNNAHLEFRKRLAEAAGTTPENVAIQCVHQHNAPFVCLDAEAITREYPDIPHTVDLDFFNECTQRAALAVKESLTRLQPVTHVAHSEATVERVASNRRFLDENGKIKYWRASACTDPTLIALPEGLIDPKLKTVAFYNQDQKLVACHYYATHPMSFYGDGRVNSDFVGLARKRLQAEQPETAQIYFTGCSGNVAAGKYNDRTPQARIDLTDRIYAAMAESNKHLAPKPIQQINWSQTPIHFEPHPDLSEDSLLKSIAAPETGTTHRIINAMKLGWLRRCQQKIPVILSALHINDITMLHLPGESFIEYQLWSQSKTPDRFVATAAYGDDGMWYIPIDEAYPQGGYEVSVAFSAPTSESILKAGVDQLNRT